MSAKNGSTRSFRTSGRLIGCALAALLAMSALFAGSASAAKPTPITHSYLALGDSLAFGYSAKLYKENESAGDPATAFEAGYVQDYARRLHGAKTFQTQDLGCPGETSASLLGNGPVADALAASSFKSATEAPCAYQEAWNAYHTDGAGGPLHVNYAGKSQLEEAIELIAVDAATGKPVTMITLNIGANDQLHAIAACEAEVKHEYETEGKSKYGATPEEAGHNCIVAHVPGLIESIIKNTEAAAYAIRSGAFNAVPYTGKIIFQAGYDPYGVLYRVGEGPLGGKELLAGSLGLAALINTHEEEAYAKPAVEGGFAPCIANPYPKFNPKNRTEPGKLQKWTNMLTGDIHPTPEGYKVLANLMKADCGGE
jgi:lysophospholipase L1-like esterase